MKKNNLLFGGLLLIGILTSCDKKNNSSLESPFWSVGNDMHTDNNVVVLTAPSLTQLRMRSNISINNELTFAFQMGSLPYDGNFKVDYLASNPMMCNVYVTYKGDQYDVSPNGNNSYVNVSALPDGKGRYELQPTWFYKHLSATDSILVKAIVIAP